ncbi:hypothetical protein [uncultured Sphingomonas sp.]|uniref:hypothetical protein n=1 Tax=uncultured Sphingomonas sp. TaxID=158754 RepID=UPI002606BD9B|nr:hypothetical protein [uncultured Sphingomonas sp.]
MTEQNEPLKAADAGAHPKAEKYGMPIEYADRIVQRHFGVTDDQLALDAGQVAADIEVSKALAGKG